MKQRMHESCTVFKWMKKLFVRFILILFSATLGACAPSTYEAASQVVDTTKPSSEPQVQQQAGYRLVRGATRLVDPVVEFTATNQTMHVKGTLEYFSMKTQAHASVPVDLSGTLNPSGMILLKDVLVDSTKKSERKIVAKATCLSEARNCQASFIDIYLSIEGVVYHHQIESRKEDAKSAPVIKQPELFDDTEGGADEVEGEPGPYVGTIQEDIETLLEVKSEPKPPKSEPAPLSAVSQAIGPVNSGHLQNATDVLKLQLAHRPAGFNIIRPTRRTHFSTNELAFLLLKMGQFTKKEAPGQILSVGDLSRESGGALGSHKSHQNGLDADIGFYFDNKSFHGYFASAVAVDKPHANWMPEAQWRLFKEVVGTKLVDRIFIHSTLKKALCSLAVQSGELHKDKPEGLAYETLRRLIADTDHNTHFHLRVKCSSAQVRCRQMAEPAPGSGCF